LLYAIFVEPLVATTAASPAVDVAPPPSRCKDEQNDNERDAAAEALGDEVAALETNSIASFAMRHQHRDGHSPPLGDSFFGFGGMPPPRDSFVGEAFGGAVGRGADEATADDSAASPSLEAMVASAWLAPAAAAVLDEAEAMPGAGAVAGDDGGGDGAAPRPGGRVALLYAKGSVRGHHEDASRKGSSSLRTK